MHPSRFSQVCQKEQNDASTAAHNDDVQRVNFPKWPACKVLRHVDLIENEVTMVRDASMRTPALLMIRIYTHSANNGLGELWWDTAAGQWWHVFHGIGMFHMRIPIFTLHINAMLISLCRFIYLTLFTISQASPVYPATHLHTGSPWVFNEQPPCKPWPCPVQLLV